MTQYVILPRVVTEEMAEAWNLAPLDDRTTEEDAQADLDAFISAAPDHGLVAVSREDLRELMGISSLSYPADDQETAFGRLSSALEGK